MLQTILDALWRNWMFRLSLSSNELFHSNFLQAVLGEAEPELSLELDSHSDVDLDSEAKLEPGLESDSEDDDDKTCLTTWARVRMLATWAQLAPDWVDGIQEKFGSNPVFLHREWKKQLDLAVVVRVQKGRRKPREVVLFALELKIKSYPTRSQLDRYQTLMKEHNGKKSGFDPQLVLLSLIRPLEETLWEMPQLKLMNFAQLASGLQDLVPSSGALAPAISEYVRCCGSLHQLSQYWHDHLKPETTLQEVISARATYRRLHPIWSKLCAAYLCELVNEEMAGFGMTRDFGLEPEPGFSNGKWKADFLWCRPEHLHFKTKREQNSAGVVAKVGVQIEGDTLRFMLNALNVGRPGITARGLVEEVLLERAFTHGLYQRLHTLHSRQQNPAADDGNGDSGGDVDTFAFWDADQDVIMLENGLPALSAPNPNSGYRLTGYNNGVNFGHADYRIRLNPAVSLGRISKIIAAALKGKYNANEHQDFVDLLDDMAAFVVAN